MQSTFSIRLLYKIKMFNNSASASSLKINKWIVYIMYDRDHSLPSQFPGKSNPHQQSTNNINFE